MATERYKDLDREELIRRLREAEDLVQRRTADLAALRLNEERLQIAAESAQFGIFDVDLATGTAYWSPALRRLVGVPLDAPTPAVGQLPACIHPDDVEHARVMFEPPFTTADSGEYGMAHRIVLPDGSVRWVEAKGRVEFGGEGNRRRPVRICGALMDITDRKQAEEAAGQRLQEIEDLYRNAPVGLCVLDRDLRWLRINDRLAEMNGFTAAEHIGRRLRDLLPGLADAVEASLRTAIETGKPCLNVEIVGETPAQPGIKRSWVEHLLPILDERRRATGLSIVVEEITERRRAEAALRESEERLRLAQESARLGIWEWSPDSGALRWTRELEALYGFREGSFEGAYSDFAKRVHPDDLAQVERLRDAAVAAHERFDLDFRIVRPDGTIRWLNAKGSAAYDAAGRPQRVFGVNIDITERKQSEEALREADRRKDEFLATLAHELRNPLVPIRNAAEILKLYNALDPTLQRVRDLLDRQVQHLVRLIDDLLDVSRISRGKLQLRKERVELRVVLDSALEVARPLIEAAGHELELSLPARPVHLDADPVRLAQVFCNLLDNACKFTARGGRIRVSAEQSEAEVVVSVADSGRGIAPEQLEHVFDMFAQLPAAPERVRSGLGIGLALTRGLVEMHGGLIAAHSEGLGRGSTFEVRLPAAAPAPEERTEQTPRPNRAARRCRVLLAEDHPDVRESLALLLELHGHEVATACDGLEAVEAAGRLLPDLVLLDLGMPALDGCGACRRIREQASEGRPMIVALSGWGQGGDRCLTKEAEFDGHLVKPVAASVLLDVVAQALARRADRTESATAASSNGPPLE
jgi:PAS domain S-box-containing protein